MDGIEILGLVAATFTTGAFVPQVYKTWKEKSTKDISFTMYTILLIGAIMWIVYGFSLQSLPIIIANLATAVLLLIMLILKVRHK
ncbi:SemiSWEET family sugar transporter [Maribacter ulvicola]|uniref:MtN3 and saliva related transmembrane protein n=1 Tax=Maribacter ulvicola TaxID=228959 RepID=A0A1N6NSF7_9FLAO|nr:SemiSWEET transporter [Maribacter ulvicola]SIP94937.1 MtN3 and saliva related transmembrane protein [Maribacter ulvicola]